MSHHPSLLPSPWTRPGLLAGLLLLSGLGIAGRAQEDPRLENARLLLKEAGRSEQVELALEGGLGNPEAFSIRREGQGFKILGGGPGGILYGVKAYLASPGSPPEGVDKPDFELRGTVLFLMKEGHYDFRLTPEEFPWFYDRPLLTRFFDHLLEHRFNAIFLWTAHLFPSIMDLPAYPDALCVSREELQRNQEQFRWFTHECARRNIKLLLHFYSIHISQALAQARGIPVHYKEPSEFLAEYMRYTLKRFLEEFESVGLYVCPGEYLKSEYQPEWIRDVIFRAARESGRNPVIVIRDWFMDTDLFKRVCKGAYDNTYTELKHNVEMIASTVPDDRHREWLGVMKKHIVNVHEASDVKPFRWGSPRFIREMVGEWRRLGLDGAEVYGLVSWRWPYTLDKLEPGQRGFWPEGRKLLTMERDAIWLTAFGRYLWRAERDAKGEEAWWRSWLAGRFGNEEAGRLFLSWYDVSGPVLPGLQNLTSVETDNRFPTVVAKEQDADSILTARKWMGEPYVGHYPDTLAHYPSQPVDPLFFQRYRQRYSMPDLEIRVSLPVAQYAHLLSRGQEPGKVMTPDKVLDLLLEMAEESLALARRAAGAATASQEEAGRFVTDSEALVLVARVWRHKVLAALEKRLWQLTGEEKHLQGHQGHLENAVKVYEELVALTDRTYLSPSDIRLTYSWPNGLKQTQHELALLYAAEAWRHISAALLARQRHQEAGQVHKPTQSRNFKEHREAAVKWQERLNSLVERSFLSSMREQVAAQGRLLAELAIEEGGGSR